MLEPLAVTPLTTDQIAQAYPLAREVAPALDLEAWRAFAHQRIAAPAGGIVGLRDPRGYLHGLFGYRVLDQLACRPMLEIDLVVTLELTDRSTSVTALVDAIHARARHLGCHDIEVRLRPDQRRMRRWFERHGHSLSGVTLGRPVGA